MTLVLTALGYIFGTWNERNHYRSILKREKRFLTLPATTSSEPMGELGNITKVVLAQGGVVISIDYFKRILAGFRSFFGGEVRSYETLIERARREAILRLKEQAKSLGAHQVFNIKFETSSISKNARGGIGSIEVLAYGTALIALKSTAQNTNMMGNMAGNMAGNMTDNADNKMIKSH